MATKDLEPPVPSLSIAAAEWGLQLQSLRNPEVAALEARRLAFEQSACRQGIPREQARLSVLSQRRLDCLTAPIN